MLDPEQNSTFRDNYLAVPFDLSRVMFIGTANVLDQIPGPLRDRMEVIELPGYTEDEKVEIAKRYLMKRQLDATGLTPEQCEITEDAIRAIIRDYTREAGVRNLEREIGAILPSRRHARCRRQDRPRADRRRASARHPRAAPLRERSGDAHHRARRGDRACLDADRRRHPVRRGRARARQRQADPHRPARRRDEGKRASGAEPGQGARVVARRRPGLFEKSDIHVHVPAGAIPKDGPSAGVAMFIALVSLLTGRTVRSDTAMTGEISLRGLVLPIGGVKNKVLAAVRAGITTVLLPERNKKDFEDVPEAARNAVRFVWLSTVDDAVEAALEPLPPSRPEARSALAARRQRLSALSSTAWPKAASKTRPVTRQCGGQQRELPHVRVRFMLGFTRATGRRSTRSRGANFCKGSIAAGTALLLSGPRVLRATRQPLRQVDRHHRCGLFRAHRRPRVAGGRL